jgi:hypothetical protein
MKPNMVVAEIGYRLKIVATKEHIPLLVKLDANEKTWILEISDWQNGGWARNCYVLEVIKIYYV